MPSGAIEILIFDPFTEVNDYISKERGVKNLGVHENLWIKMSHDPYVSVGAYLEGPDDLKDEVYPELMRKQIGEAAFVELRQNKDQYKKALEAFKGQYYLDHSEVRYYVFEDRDKRPLKVYSSLSSMLEDTSRLSFESMPELFLMAHGRGGYYGLCNHHRISDRMGGHKFDHIINEYRGLSKSAGPCPAVTLEGCNTDDYQDAVEMGQTATFLERLSETHPDITFIGTRPWNPSDNGTGVASSGGYPDLHSPIDVVKGGTWNYCDVIVFHHQFDHANLLQLATKKPMYSTIESAKSLKLNTVAYAIEVLNSTSIERNVREQLLREICLSRDVVKINDLSKIRGFPVDIPVSQALFRLSYEESRITLHEKRHYISKIEEILKRAQSATCTDRDYLDIALGLKNGAEIFSGNGHLLEVIFSDEILSSSVMAACGKVLIADSSNDEIIDYLLSRGVDINSKDSNGMTALHHAAQCFYNYRDEPSSLVRKLLNCGADPTLKTHPASPSDTSHTPSDLLKAHSEDPRVVNAIEIQKLLTDASQLKQALVVDDLEAIECTPRF